MYLKDESNAILKKFDGLLFEDAQIKAYVVNSGIIV